MRYLFGVIGILLAAIPHVATAQGSAQQFVVVVNSANAVSSVHKNELSKIFLKKIAKWRDKKEIVAVDQERRAKIRDTFARAVHEQSAASLNVYWQTQIFSGKTVPPITKATDEAVLDFVRSNPHAVGYVSTATPLGTGVKAVVITGL